MADEVVADPGYLHYLAERQRSAADRVSGATSDTGFGHDISRTHGVYVRAGVNAIWDAIDARKAAGAAMDKLSKSLADRLDQGGVMYASTDQRQGEDLDKHMQDG